MFAFCVQDNGPNELRARPFEERWPGLSVMSQQCAPNEILRRAREMLDTVNFCLDFVFFDSQIREGLPRARACNIQASLIYSFR